MRTERPSVIAYFREQSRQYTDSSERGLWHWWKRREYAGVCKHLLPVEGQRVLEVGAGTGWYARRLLDHRPAQYIAVDLLPEMVSRISAPGVARLAGDMNALPFTKPFTRILCAGAVEFLPKPEAFFAEAARLLHPEGRLVILAPMANGWGRLYRRWHSRHGFRVHLFSPGRLRALAAAKGLRVSRVTRPAPFSLVATMVKLS